MGDGLDDPGQVPGRLSSQLCVLSIASCGVERRTRNAGSESWRCKYHCAGMNGVDGDVAFLLPQQLVQVEREEQIAELTDAVV